MIVLTGAAGFIGSCLLSGLNKVGIAEILLVDDFNRLDKEPNLHNKKYVNVMDRMAFLPWFKDHGGQVDFVFHLGARTDTTEQDIEIFDELNLNYSKQVWNTCVEHAIPLIYASSAATYGLGEYGYRDQHGIVSDLKPLNPYGISKNEFDKWVLKQNMEPPFWAGLKFFNVYGPNEYHKGRMASVIFHAFHQIKKTGGMKLFRSHRSDFLDGEQSRDFVYVKDVVDVCLFLFEGYRHIPSGLYNLGTGEARSFLDLTRSTFAAMGVVEKISFIDTPEDIRDTYQYYTEADMSKMRDVGYTQPFYTLEEGVMDYVTQYLQVEQYL